MLCTYVYDPVTFVGMSTRGGLVPTTVYELTGFVPGAPATACTGVVALPGVDMFGIDVLNSLSPMSWP